jgi:hypothetical protein
VEASLLSARGVPLDQLQPWQAAGVAVIGVLCVLIGIFNDKFYFKNSTVEAPAAAGKMLFIGVGFIFVVAGLYSLSVHF